MNDTDNNQTAEYAQGKIDGYDDYGTGYRPNYDRNTAYWMGYCDGYDQAEQDDFQHLAYSMY